MTATATTVVRPGPHHRVGAGAGLGGWIDRAMRRRAGRFRLALLVFVLLVPLLLTSMLSGR